jgi:hypothetical protein
VDIRVCLDSFSGKALSRESGAHCGQAMGSGAILGCLDLGGMCNVWGRITLSNKRSTSSSAALPFFLQRQIAEVVYLEEVLEQAIEFVGFL